MFEKTVQYTRCPFASKSAWTEVEIDARKGLTEQVSEAAERLRNEIPTANSGGKDMVSLKLTCPELLQDIHVFTQFLSSLLAALSQDPRSMGTPDLYTQPGWRYWVGDVQCFVLSFAPFYEESHPRYSNSSAAYIVFQFESSFERNGVSYMSAEELTRLSKVIRNTFEKSGRQYFEHITHGLPEAFHVIKPLFIDSPPITWWEERL